MSPFKMHESNFFHKKKIKEICVPTIPKIFRHVTRNTLFYLALAQTSENSN